jgi:catechol 2,3-dioxygenase-like lactoylglutathione lyase family enzyme
VDYKLSAVVIPVTDLDRSRHFYRALGFRLDLDQTDDEGFRVVRLTAPGSSCSIVLETGLSQVAPGSACCVLTVHELETACAELQAHGAVPGPVSRSQTGFTYARFNDPDGNQWLLLDDVRLGS